MKNGTAVLPHMVTDHVVDLAWPLAIFAATLAVGYIVRGLMLRMLRTWTARSRSRLGQIFEDALRGPILIWILILAVHLAIQFSTLPPRVVRYGPTVLLDLWVASLTLMGMRLARDLFRHYGARVTEVLPVTTLTQNLAQIAVLILGVTVLLGHYAARIGPVLGALGVGALAVALALQDTLSNLFSGFYIGVAGQIRLGDYIKLNTGEEGYVTDIGWHNTTIRALSNNMIIVPNAKLAQANVTNYYLPDKAMGASVQVNVRYDSDPDLVERVLLEVATQGVQDISGLLANPAPSVALDPGFGDFALCFTVGYMVSEFTDQFGVRNELRKRILRRFRAEGIAMAFPTRTVHIEGGRPE